MLSSAFSAAPSTSALCQLPLKPSVQPVVPTNDSRPPPLVRHDAPPIRNNHANPLASFIWDWVTIDGVRLPYTVHTSPLTFTQTCYIPKIMIKNCLFIKLSHSSMPAAVRQWLCLDELAAVPMSDIEAVMFNVINVQLAKYSLGVFKLRAGHDDMLEMCRIRHIYYRCKAMALEHTLQQTTTLMQLNLNQEGGDAFDGQLRHQLRTAADELAECVRSCRLFGVKGSTCACLLALPPSPPQASMPLPPLYQMQNS